MTTTTGSKPPDFVPRGYMDTALQRAADAEACLRRVLNFINPALLVEHLGDWKAATDALVDE